METKASGSGDAPTSDAASSRQEAPVISPISVVSSGIVVDDNYFGEIPPLPAFQSNAPEGTDLSDDFEELIEEDEQEEKREKKRKEEESAGSGKVLTTGTETPRSCSQPAATKRGGPLLTRVAEV